MNKPFPKRRVNRGFIVSMVLLVAVLVYVLVTELMTLSVRQEIAKLPDQLAKLMEEVSLTADDRIAELKEDVSAQQAELQQLKTQLAPLFVKDAAYIDAAAASFYQPIAASVEGSQRITRLTQTDRKITACTIDDNVANIKLEYRYTMSGEFMNYNKETLQPVSDQEIIQEISAVCQKVDGQWKLFRVGGMYRRFTNYTDAIKGVGLQ